MWTFIVRRLLWGILTLFVIAILGFLIMRFAPGSPFTAERLPDPEILRKLEQKYGLDKPLHVQFWNTMVGYFHGDLGASFKVYDKSVNDIVIPAMGTSIQLGAISFVLAMILGIPIGIIAATKQNKAPDHLAMSVSLLGICVPNFLLGPILVLIFFFALGWLPPTGWPRGFPPTFEEWKMILMPALTLSLVHVAYISRLMRAGMLDVMNRDYIRTARAKGLNERRVVLRHALKNAITPVLSYSGPMAAAIITGSIVVEQIFNVNGLGQHFVKSALNRDYPVVMATVLVYSTLIVFFNLLVDIGYGFLDPRVRVS